VDCESYLSQITTSGTDIRLWHSSCHIDIGSLKILLYKKVNLAILSLCTLGICTLSSCDETC
jgi:hypothetical protein